MADREGLEAQTPIEERQEKSNREVSQINGLAPLVDGESRGLIAVGGRPIGRFSEDDALKISHACQMLA